MVISFLPFAFCIPATSSALFKHFLLFCRRCSSSLSPVVKWYHPVQVHSEFYCSRRPLQTGCMTYIWHINNYRSTETSDCVFSEEKKMWLFLLNVQIPFQRFCSIISYCGIYCESIYPVKGVAVILFFYIKKITNT